jgi:EamA domain-containing membrane protein RarD
MTAAQVHNHSHDARQREQRIFAASFGLVVLLVAQYVLGLAYNLYGTAPTAARKLKPFSSPLLAAHVVLGTLLIVVAIYLVAAAVRARTRIPATASIIGLAALIAAWIAGSAFAQNGANGYSMAMGVLTAVALLCYTAIVTVLGARNRAAASASPGAG